MRRELIWCIIMTDDDTASFHSNHAPLRWGARTRSTSSSVPENLPIISKNYPALPITKNWLTKTTHFMADGKLIICLILSHFGLFDAVKQSFFVGHQSLLVSYCRSFLQVLLFSFFFHIPLHPVLWAN